MANQQKKGKISSCEKCWGDANGNSEKYGQLIRERKDNPCTPEAQAGRYAETCEKCNRKTIHQYVKRCMNPGCLKNL